jgi:hypothetical protein
VLTDGKRMDQLNGQRKPVLTAHINSSKNPLKISSVAHFLFFDAAKPSFKILTIDAPY